MRKRIDQFIFDASRISSDLDRISRRDGTDVRAEAVESGRQAYEKLLARQSSLVIPRADASLVEIVLDGIQARLRFLS